MLPEIIGRDPAGPASPARLVLRSNSPEATAGLGWLLASLLQPDDVVSLDGDLGAGKTALTQGIAAGLRCRGHVASPTFTLLMEHPACAGGLALYHFDAYRLGGSADFCEAGLNEYFCQGGVSVVEWGSLIADILPERTLQLLLYQDDPEYPDRRRISLQWPARPENLDRLAAYLDNHPKEA